MADLAGPTTAPTLGAPAHAREGEPRAAGRAADEQGPVIELHAAGKTYRTGTVEFEALRGVDLAIHQGEYVAIMGPSGSGKSTLMNILGCLDVLTTGQYRLAGDDVGDLDEEDLAAIRNHQIGFVFQQFHLLPSLSAWRNVELPLTYRELSGGQQQRVAVARALVGEPAMILADEPTGNLDSASTEDVLGLFDDLHAQGRTIVLITHELEVAERARRIVRVRDGLIQSDTLTSGVAA